MIDPLQEFGHELVDHIGLAQEVFAQLAVIAEAVSEANDIESMYAATSLMHEKIELIDEAFRIVFGGLMQSARIMGASEDEMNEYARIHDAKMTELKKMYAELSIGKF